MSSSESLCSLCFLCQFNIDSGCVGGLENYIYSLNGRVLGLLGHVYWLKFFKSVFFHVPLK